MGMATRDFRTYPGFRPWPGLPPVPGRMDGVDVTAPTLAAGAPLEPAPGGGLRIAVNLDNRVVARARPLAPGLDLRRHDAVLLTPGCPALRLARDTRLLLLTPSAQILAELPLLADAARDGGPTPLPGDSLLGDLAQALRIELGRSDDATVLALMARALLAHVERRLRGGGGRAEGGRATRLQDYKIRRVQDFVDANLTEAISLDQLAEVACMSRYHFARAFKEATGWTPHAFVMRRRIEHCQTLLRTSAIGLAEVAVLSGFANQSHMSTCFRRLLGTTPARYRQEATDGVWRPNVLGPGLPRMVGPVPPAVALTGGELVPA